MFRVGDTVGRHDWVKRCAQAQGGTVHDNMWLLPQKFEENFTH